MFDPPSQPAAGWYPDPHVPGAERWWNGRAWEPEWRTAGGLAGGDALPDIGDWLGRAFRRSWARWRSLLVIAVVTAAPASLLVSIGIRYAIDGVIITNEDVVGWSNSRLPLAILLAVAGSLVSILGNLATTSLMLRTVDETAPTGDVSDESWSTASTRARQALTTTFRVLPRAIGWGLLAGLVFTVAIAVVVVLMIVAAIVFWPITLLLGLALIPLAVWIGTRLAFTVQALVDRPGNPFVRSWQVARGRWWPVFGRLLLFGIIVWGISMVVNVTSSLANGTGLGRALGQSPIELDADGNLVEPVLITDFFPVSTLSIVVGIVSAVILAIAVYGVGGAAFAELYRTRHEPE